MVHFTFHAYFWQRLGLQEWGTGWKNKYISCAISETRIYWALNKCSVHKFSPHWSILRFLPVSPYIWSTEHKISLPIYTLLLCFLTLLWFLFLNLYSFKRHSLFILMTNVTLLKIYWTIFKKYVHIQLFIWHLHLTSINCLSDISDLTCQWPSACSF